MTQVTPTLRTKSGQALHPVGIGTWGYGEYPTFSPGTESEVSAIKYAISLGQNHIDTAEMYARGGSETVVGQAIKGTHREDVFVASKLWKDHVARATVRPAVEAMLKRLGTDYIDMLYIHAPWFDAPWQEAIPQICELIDEGIVRYLGASNFNAERLQEALRITRHPIAANQMHFSFLHQQEVTPELRQLCIKNGILIIAYMPLEKGEIFKSTQVASMVQRHGGTAARFALTWALEQQTIPIAKALRKEHIEQNAAVAYLK